MVAGEDLLISKLLSGFSIFASSKSEFKANGSGTIWKYAGRKWFY